MHATFDKKVMTEHTSSAYKTKNPTSYFDAVKQRYVTALKLLELRATHGLAATVRALGREELRAGTTSEVSSDAVRERYAQAVALRQEYPGLRELTVEEIYQDLELEEDMRRRKR